MADLARSKDSVEDCSNDVGNETIRCEAAINNDDYFTPPPSPHFACDFRRVVATQFEVLQSFVVLQYEKELALLVQEREHLHQRLLACESTGMTANFSQQEEWNPKEGIVLSLHSPEHVGCTDFLECLPVSHSSPRQSELSPRSLEPDPAVVCSDSASPEATVPEEIPEAKAWIITKSDANGHDLHKIENQADALQECTPLLGTDKLHEAEKRRELFAASSVKTISIQEHNITRQLYAAREDTIPFRVSRFLYGDSDTAKPGCLRFVETSKFDLVSAAVITFNAVVFAANLQRTGFDCGYAILMPDYKSAEETWPGAETVFEVFEYLFTVVFSVELMLRVVAAGPRKAVWLPWMWFDFTVISFGIIDTVGAGTLGINTSTVRLLRLIRLVRILKIFHMLQAFDSLFLLVKALQASVHAMGYSFLMLLVMQVVFGIFMCQLLQPVVLDEDTDMKVRQDIFKLFGTFSRSILTMFEISIANWVPTCRLLVDNVSEWWMLFYLLYRCMFCFAIVKVISAVFITETNRVLESDDELFIMKQRREKSIYVAKLCKMFHTIDADNDGYLEWRELQDLLKDEVSAEYITTLGFQQHDFEKLFWLIDEGNGKIPIDEFVSKVGKLKGASKTIDTLMLLKLLHRMEMFMHDAFEKQGIVKVSEESDNDEEEIEACIE